ncbi:hypothetical protein [Halomontanus rarus]|uniref:hypothetical protein n=1 Tax=Halomontanus rarus TaxID=3034020 RepID=UPI00307BBE01
MPSEYDKYLKNEYEEYMARQRVSREGRKAEERRTAREKELNEIAETLVEVERE